jgi:3-oxo-5-alpha-steroid 4-dehydrogenase 1
MESPVLWVTALCCFAARDEPALAATPNRVLLMLLCVHYLNRAFVYPFRMRAGNPMPASIAFFAFIFCTVNGYLQARALTKFKVYPVGWCDGPRFLVGVGAWLLGFYWNLEADHILRNLRQPGDTERYKIPRGGLFELVSGANFAAEILEWCGFALACNSYAALTFAVFTFLNTAPRGVAHHKWYLDKFKDYPKNRKGVIPYVW